VSTSDAGPDAGYWNAPFGAYIEHTAVSRIDALLAFWQKGR
jgi:hypothetical protein